MSDEDDIGNNVPLEKTKTIKEKSPEKTVETKVTAVLPKKPRTEKQKTQFQQVMNKRQENIEKKKLEKKLEASKLLAEKDPEFFKQLHNKKEVEIVDVPSPVF
jgi:RIO-like serine/threonine protein kinase